MPFILERFENDIAIEYIAKNIERYRGFEDMEDKISSSLNPGLRLVVITEHACDYVRKRAVTLNRRGRGGGGQ